MSLASAMLAGSVHAQTIELPQIEAEGQSGGGYQAVNPGLSRIPTPLIDTPQTVNVVTQQVIQEQRATTMEEALRNVPGITFSAGEGGQQGDSPIIRGFVGRADMFRDGVRDPGWYTRDLFSVDRVEVYKGPSAFAFGRGATGGAINNVSRLPLGPGVRYLDGTLTASTPQGLRAEVDAAGTVGNVAGRIAVMAQDVDTPGRDNVNTKRFGFAPSIRFDITDQTRLTASYVLQSEDSVPDYGHPYLPPPTYNANNNGLLGNLGYNGNGTATGPVPIPRSNWFGVAGGSLADRVQTTTNIATIKVEHDLADKIKLTNTTRYLTVGRMARPTAPRSLFQADNVTPVTAGYPVEQMTIGRQRFQINTDNAMIVNQTDVNARFNTGWLEHTLAAGIEIANEQRWQQRMSGMQVNNLCDPTNVACRTSLYSPVDTSFGGTLTGSQGANTTNSDSVALYASDQVKVNKYFELMGAIRFDRFATSYKDPGNATPGNRDVGRTDNLTSWRVGVVVHPVENTSVHAAFGNSFNPSAELGTLTSTLNSTNNISLAPEENKSLEFGAKADLFGGWLSLTGAVFRIEKTNMRIVNDPSLLAAAQVIVLDGLASVQGVELGAVGKITEQWQVSAGYAYQESEIERTTVLADRGKQLPSTPQHSVTLWSTYNITPLWTVGGGAFYQSAAFANTANTNYVPGYVRFDAMASYKVTSNATLQLNLYNLTDELYYSQYYGGHAVPAPGRSASLSLNVRW